MKKKILSVLLGLTLAATSLVGCGSANTGSDKLTPVKVAASTTPHAEILAQAKDAMAKKGYDLQVVEFADYVQPNMVVESGEFDANYFQHINYLNSFNDEQDTHLVNAGSIHYEPLGIYPGKENDLSKISEGATIAIPNDTTNEARALLLLEENGLITLKEGKGINATVLDIESNPKKLEFVELESAQISRMIGEVAFVVLNGNYALQAGLNVKEDAVASENSNSEVIKQQYVNIIAVKEGNENKEAIKTLVEILKSDAIVKYINDTYNGSVIPFK
jgi:D-methionine transport system substrate-binding protein